MLQLFLKKEKELFIPIPDVNLGKVAEKTNTSAGFFPFLSKGGGGAGSLHSFKTF